MSSARAREGSGAARAEGVAAARAAGAGAFGPPVLTLLYREGCHLCDEMEQLLHELLEPGSFVLRRTDIDEHPALLAEHHVRVPVLFLGEVPGGRPDGRPAGDARRGASPEPPAAELCHHFLDLEAVRSALAGYTSPAGHP